MLKSVRRFPVVSLLLLAIASLAFAYFTEYVLGYVPCKLCLYQRAPFFGVIGVMIYALLSRRESFKKYLIALAAMLFFGNAALAFYHAGVEWKFFEGPETCSHASEAQTLEDLKAELDNAPLARCDEPAFRVFGLSMAGWNSLWCLALGILAVYLVKYGNWSHTKKTASPKEKRAALAGRRKN